MVGTPSTDERAGVLEENAIGYTQPALDSQAKASLVQGCACALA